ncbi:MAG TPA: adenosine kinase [Bacteroidales bacterium]
MTKVLGIGNALVDLLVSLENDDLLVELKLPKGSMTLVDEKTKENIARLVAALKREMASGGSAANTIHGLARLGVKTAFIGKIGLDEIGEFFQSDLVKSGIEPLLYKSKSASGLASAMISLDGERTFGTYLGAAVELSGSDLKSEHFKDFGILHVEGYLVQNHELLESIMKQASAAGLMISLDLASYNVVEANLDFLKRIAEKYVDLIFANEEEAKAFTGKEPAEALNEISKISKIAVVKIGKKGSLVKSGDLEFEISPVTAKAIDTTGAGDLYASGFIYGLINGLPLDKAGQIGSILSSTVIENIGAKIPDNSWPVLKEKIKSISLI